MKKIINIIAAAALVTFSMSSCDLNKDPEGDIKGSKIYNYEAMIGLRAGAYSGFKSMFGGGFYAYPDISADIFSETSTSGGQGASFFRWTLKAGDSDIQTIYLQFYSRIATFNKNIENFKIMIEKDTNNTELTNEQKESRIDFYNRCLAEHYYFRAYSLFAATKLFCPDYEVDTKDAANTGLPTPDKYDIRAQLPRGTIGQTYEHITKDIQSALDYFGKAGNENNAIASIYLSKDAILSLKAAVAMQMDDYDTAIDCATEIRKGPYALATSKEDLAKMWNTDVSNEVIFQPEVTKTSLGSVSGLSMYIGGVWSEADKKYKCTPSFVPENWILELFADEDYRSGLYLSKASVVLGQGTIETGKILMKFRGNENLQSSPTVWVYKNMPKVARLSEILLIEAESRYMNKEGITAVLEPLNKLRTGRGLAELPASTTLDDAWTEIRNERTRELVGEGHRLNDLRRWKMGFARDCQSNYEDKILSNVGLKLKKEAGDNGFVWPIPISELSTNKNFGAQNPGYAGL